MQESGGTKKIGAEEVISKLKDDGDFDTLRLKIIRKLKGNEDLRNSIISAVKQSEALNCDGAEKLKPRQLSDAIHQEIGSKVMAQISDGLWDIIRGSDDVKNEITETVQSVYDKLMNPKGKEVEDNLPLTNKQLVCNTETNASTVSSPSDRNITHHDSESDEPPGFGQWNCPQTNGNSEEHNVSTQEQKPGNEFKQEPSDPPDAVRLNDSDPPGFATACGNPEHRNDGNDDDPDIPPGFG